MRSNYTRSKRQPKHKRAALFALVLLTCSCFSAALAAATSVNVGLNSHYVYRGIPQEKWSVNAGLDIEAEGFYFGTFSQDFGGEYFELGYGGTFSPGANDLFDYALSIVRSSDELSGKISGGQPDEDTFLNLSFSKGFSF